MREAIKVWLMAAVIGLAVCLLGQVEAEAKPKKTKPPGVVQVDVARDAVRIVSPDTQALIGYGYTVLKPGEYQFTLPPGTWDVSVEVVEVEFVYEVPLGYAAGTLDWWAIETDPLPYTIVFRQTQ